MGDGVCWVILLEDFVLYIMFLRHLKVSTHAICLLHLLKFTQVKKPLDDKATIGSYQCHAAYMQDAVDLLAPICTLQYTEVQFILLFTTTFKNWM